MPVVVVANPKGGVGKSTLATHIAGYLANSGHAVMLGDVDRQQSSRLWLGLRPTTAARIQGWELQDGRLAKPPKGITHVVLDTPAGLHGKRLNEVMKLAHKIVIPLQPSVFDIFATRAFLDLVLASKRAMTTQIGIVAMRVHERTYAAEHLQAFVRGLDIPVLATLRDTQNYVHLAAGGLTLFDVAATRVQKDRAQWSALCRWLDN